MVVDVESLAIGIVLEESLEGLEEGLGEVGGEKTIGIVVERVEDEFGEVGVFWSKKVNSNSKVEMVEGFSLHLTFCVAHFKCTVLACSKVSAETLSVCISDFSLEKLSSLCSFNRSEILSAQFFCLLL